MEEEINHHYSEADLN
jgi:type II secretory pathway component PulM